MSDNRNTLDEISNLLFSLQNQEREQIVEQITHLLDDRDKAVDIVNKIKDLRESISVYKQKIDELKELNVTLPQYLIKTIIESPDYYKNEFYFSIFFKIAAILYENRSLNHADRKILIADFFKNDHKIIDSIISWINSFDYKSLDFVYSILKNKISSSFIANVKHPDDKLELTINSKIDDLLSNLDVKTDLDAKIDTMISNLDPKTIPTNTKPILTNKLPTRTNTPIRKTTIENIQVFVSEENKNLHELNLSSLHNINAHGIAISSIVLVGIDITLLATGSMVSASIIAVLTAMNVCSYMVEKNFLNKLKKLYSDYIPKSKHKNFERNLNEEIDNSLYMIYSGLPLGFLFKLNNFYKNKNSFFNVNRWYNLFGESHSSKVEKLFNEFESTKKQTLLNI